MIIRTTKKVEVVDITEKVAAYAEGTGILHVFVPHTTAAVVINEAEENLMRDMEELFAEMVPAKDWRHDRVDDNARAHLMASILGQGVCIPVEGGRIILGTWQRVLFVELDGPRERRVLVRMIQ